MNLRRFELPHGKHVLQGDTFEMGCETMVLRGAGKSSRARFSRIRESLNAHGIPSASFDFIGHGETGGELVGTTLHERTEQVASVIGHACKEPLTLIAASKLLMAIYCREQFNEKISINRVRELRTSILNELFNNSKVTAPASAKGKNVRKQKRQGQAKT